MTLDVNVNKVVAHLNMFYNFVVDNIFVQGRRLELLISYFFSRLDFVEK
jgi:hypothetical protein